MKLSPPKSIRRYIAGNIVLILGGSLLVGISYFDILSNNTTATTRAIGSAVLASGLVGIIYYFYLKRERRYEEAIELVDSWGLDDIREGRGRQDTESYKQAMIDCENHLHIQAISLRRFQTDLGDVLDRLGERGVEIRLLLLDPESDICEWYGEVDDDYSDLKTKIRDSAEEFLSRDIDTLELRYYKGLPVNYFRADDRVFFGPYFAKQPSRNTVTFLADKNKKLVEGYEKNFEEYWNSHSRKVTEDSV